MVTPDRYNIAQVKLYTQGFIEADTLSRSIVLLFELCKKQLSQQEHYDFGLRALKAVLVLAGDLKREKKNAPERDLIIKSIMYNLYPKIVIDDKQHMDNIMQTVFFD